MRTPARASFVVEYSLLLVAGTGVALAWANLGPVSYEHFAASMRFAVNDVAMVFFFALAAKEIVEATLPGGPLASGREATVPLLAAAGGMIVPAALYVLAASMLGYPELRRGWAIPCATDIAFSYMTARWIFHPRHAAIPFLLLLAVADDALGLILLAVFYPTGEVSLLFFVVLMPAAISVAWLLRARRIRAFWAYVGLAGSLSWAALYWGGLHPALSLVPVVPFMPHERRYHDLFDRHEPTAPDTLNQFARWWRVPTQIILFFFGLVNAGVSVTSVGPATWLVVLALLVGKPVGIVLAAVLSGLAGFRLPGRLTYLQLVVIGLTAAIGFTVALFFATAAFPPGSTLEQAKIGALLSFLAAPLAVGLGWAVGLTGGREAER
jgi:Na+:H+ antiporter, NhaA family